MNVLPIDVLLDTLTDAELDALADAAERERREDEFLDRLEAELLRDSIVCI